MRTPFLLAVLIIVGGAATHIGKTFLLRSDLYAKQERLLTSYRINPHATLERVSAAYLACSDSEYAKAPAAEPIRHLAALLTLEAIRQKVEGVGDVVGKERAIQIMQAHIPSIQAKLPVSRDGDQVQLYLQALREEGVPTCVISSSA
jgi:hypothetical protein